MMNDYKLVISIRCDESREGLDRMDQITTVKAARRAARVLSLNYNNELQPHDVEAVSVTVPESYLDVFLLGMRESGGDHKRVVTVYGDPEEEIPMALRLKLMALFTRDQLDL